MTEQLSPLGRIRDAFLSGHINLASTQLLARYFDAEVSNSYVKHEVHEAFCRDDNSQIPFLKKTSARPFYKKSLLQFDTRGNPKPVYRYRPSDDEDPQALVAALKIRLPSRGEKDVTSVFHSLIDTEKAGKLAGQARALRHTKESSGHHYLGAGHRWLVLGELQQLLSKIISSTELCWELGKTETETFSYAMYRRSSEDLGCVFARNIKLDSAREIISKFKAIGCDIF